MSALVDDEQLGIFVAYAEDAGELAADLRRRTAAWTASHCTRRRGGPGVLVGAAAAGRRAAGSLRD